VWRKLRRLGVAQLADGLVGLPQDARTREQLEWIADEVLEAGGSAVLWSARPTASGDERQIAQQLSADRTQEYADLAERAVAALDAPPAEQRRALRSLRSELRAVRRRDYFSAPGKGEATRAVDDLACGITVDESSTTEHEVRR
jgi:hypothetical protein